MRLPEWIVLDLNSFFASCEQQENPELRGKPVGVVPMMADSTCLLAASVQAKTFGLKTGTIVKEAKQRCPDLHLVRASHQRYVQYHHKVLEAIDRVIPIDEVLSIDEVSCRLTGSQREMAKALRIAQEMKESIRAHAGECLTSSVGISTNILLAKLGSDMQKPDGLTVLMPEDFLPKAGHLPASAIAGVGHKMALRLEQEGVRTIRELLALNEAEMVRIWGSIVGSRYYHRLRGEDIPLPKTHTRSLGHQHVLEPELRTRQGGLETVKQLLVKGAERLRRKGYYARHLSLHVRSYHPQRASWENQTDFAETQDTRSLLAALDAMWKTMPFAKPHRVGVVFSGLVPKERHQFDIFETQKPQQLFSAVDKINERFGRNTLFFAGSQSLRKAVEEHKIAFSNVPDKESFPGQGRQHKPT